MLVAFELFACLWPSGAKSQPSAEGLYVQLVENFYRDHPALRSRPAEGLVIPADSILLKVDTTLGPAVRFSPAEIEYKRLDRSRWQRVVSTQVNWQEQGLRSQPLMATDTLQKAQLRRLLKTSPASWKGENPLPWARWIQPATLLAGSIGAIVALFYWRSPGR